MHVGSENLLCPTLKVHNTIMKTVPEDVYLGDVVRADGKNTSNIQNRVSKGIGLISQIMNILETVSFGKSYFKIALILRESIFLNGILTNVEVWYGLSKSEIKELESVDRLLLRRILSVPISTCSEALFLETGCLNIGTIIKGRRLNFLQYLTKQDKNSMLYKFFKVQWDFPVKGDWTLDCKQDLVDLNFPDSLEFFEQQSKDSFNKKVKQKCKEFAAEKFNLKKNTHSKMANLYYSELKIQGYLQSEEITVENSKILLSWRLRMARFGANYGNRNELCPLCKLHLDSQENCFNICKEIKTKIQITCKYENIFNGPFNEVAQILKKITKIRETNSM